MSRSKGGKKKAARKYALGKVYTILLNLLLPVISNKYFVFFATAVETMEHKFRQERILVEDLRTSLTVEQEKVAQLSDALNKEKAITSDLRDEISRLQIKLDRLTNTNERLDARVTDIT